MSKPRTPRVNPILTQHPMRNANPITAVLEATRKGQAEQVPLSSIRIRKDQPRRYFDLAKHQSLTASIKQSGVLVPIVLRPSDGALEIVAGERRYRAALEAKLTHIPAVVRELDDQQAQEVALAENLQREDLNPYEETEGMLDLLSLRLKLGRGEVVSLLNHLDNAAKGRITHNVMGNEKADEVAQIFEETARMSWQSFIANRLPLLKMPTDVTEVLRQGRLEYTKARAIARVKDEGRRRALLEGAIAGDWSLSQIKLELSRHSPKPKAKQLSDSLARLSRLSKKHHPSLAVQKQVNSLIQQIETLLIGETGSRR